MSLRLLNNLEFNTNEQNFVFDIDNTFGGIDFEREIKDLPYDKFNRARTILLEIDKCVLLPSGALLDREGLKLSPYNISTGSKGVILLLLDRFIVNSEELGVNAIETAIRNIACGSLVVKPLFCWTVVDGNDDHVIDIVYNDLKFSTLRSLNIFISGGVYIE